MLTAVQALVFSTALTLIMLLTGSTLRSKMWTAEGIAAGFGNREGESKAEGVAGRADRAANNMLEGMVMFIAVMVAARYEGGHAARVELGATVFFYARLVYWLVYLAGIPYLRTAVWGVSLAGIVIIGAAIL